MVKVYSVSDCQWCRKVKSYLTSKNIAFVEINVEQDLEGRKELAVLSPEMNVPVVNIDGNIIVGYDRDQMDEYLHL